MASRRNRKNQQPTAKVARDAHIGGVSERKDVLCAQSRMDERLRVRREELQAAGQKSHFTDGSANGTD